MLISIMASHVSMVHRVPVSMIVGSVADGMTFDEILEAYPQLKKGIYSGRIGVCGRYCPP